MKAEALNRISTVGIQKRVQTDLCLLAIQMVMGEEKAACCSRRPSAGAKAPERTRVQ